MCACTHTTTVNCHQLNLTLIAELHKAAQIRWCKFWPDEIEFINYLNYALPNKELHIKWSHHPLHNLPKIHRSSKWSRQTGPKWNLESMTIQKWEGLKFLKRGLYRCGAAAAHQDVLCGTPIVSLNSIVRPTQDVHFWSILGFQMVSIPLKWVPFAAHSWKRVTNQRGGCVHFGPKMVGLTHESIHSGFIRNDAPPTHPTYMVRPSSFSVCVCSL